MLRRLCSPLVAAAVSLGVAFPQTPAQPKTRPQTFTLGQLSSSLQRLSRRVSPAVVQIITSGYYPVRGEDGSSVTTETGTGSGVIVDPEGYIITNAHVIEGAQRVRVLLAGTATTVGDVDGPILEDGNSVAAEVRGSDSETDLALLKIDRRGLPALKLADSSALRQGELVLACGSPFGLENTISMGIVSSVARQLKPESIMAYIQTDAPINPGNSGGALVNMHGEVVGINALILSQSGGNEGLGFAIPSNVVANAYRQLRNDGHVHHGEIGVVPRAVDTLIAAGLHLPVQKGVILEDVVPDGPADDAGLKPGDVIVEVDGRPLTDPRRLGVDIAHRTIGDSIKLLLWRGKDRLTLPVTVRERSDDPHRFIDLLKTGSAPIPQLAILALDVSEKLSPMLPELRRPAGVVVAAMISSRSGPPEDFEPGDLISSVNGEAVLNVAGLRALLEKLHSGDPVVVELQRSDQLVLIAFELP